MHVGRQIKKGEGVAARRPNEPAQNLIIHADPPIQHHEADGGDIEPVNLHPRYSAQTGSISLSFRAAKNKKTWSWASRR